MCPLGHLLGWLSYSLRLRPQLPSLLPTYQTELSECFSPKQSTPRLVHQYSQLYWKSTIKAASILFTPLQAQFICHPNYIWLRQGFIAPGFENLVHYNVCQTAYVFISHGCFQLNTNCKQSVQWQPIKITGDTTKNKIPCNSAIRVYIACPAHCFEYAKCMPVQLSPFWFSRCIYP